MAESDADKTEAATPRRRQEAREEGNIARSADLTSAALLVSILFLLKWFGGAIILSLRSVLREMLSAHSMSVFDPAEARPLMIHLVAQVGIALAPLLVGVVVVGIAANIAQVGFNLNFARLTPNIAALNPLKGLGKVFGGRGAMHFLMSFLKMVLVSYAAYSAVHNRITQIIAVQQLTFMQIFAFGADIVYSIALNIGVLLLVLAILDYTWQKFKFERDLRMTKEEVKEEMKRMEGDPKMKQRRRQVAIQRAMQRLKKDVPKADVIVTNPTHFAVALQYDPAAMHAPKLIAKGADLMAFRIRELGIEAGIPIVERPPLARAIYRMVDVGHEIPEEFYAAVAEILAYVYELSKKAGRPVPASMSRPAPVAAAV